MTRVVASFALSFALAALAVAQDPKKDDKTDQAAKAAKMVENPLYQSWAKQKPGTSITLKGMSEVGGQKSESTMTTKLVEATPDKVVVEFTTTAKVMGKDFSQPPTKLEFPKTITESQLAEQSNPKGKVGEGTADVKVGDKTYKTKWYKIELDQMGSKVTTTVWTSQEVPGTLVKTESQFSGMVSGKSSMELVEVK
jgi:hypothetical protein